MFVIGTPADYEEEFYLLAIESEDVDPYDIWPLDLYGSCEYSEDDDDGTEEDFVYLGDYEGRDFYVVDFETNWSHAMDSANMMGGHLATLTSADENNFLFDALEEQDLSGSYWIGLYDDEYGWC